MNENISTNNIQIYIKGNKYSLAKIEFFVHFVFRVKTAKYPLLFIKELFLRKYSNAEAVKKISHEKNRIGFNMHIYIYSKISERQIEIRW